MILWSDGWFSRGARRAAAVGAAALLLAACGGGQQVNRFVPGRVLAFGDETSIITPDGRKFSVNPPPDATTGTTDCTVQPIWVQFLANSYGVPFQECPGAFTVHPSRILAVANTQSSDVAAQIDNFVASDAFRSDDLVTIYSGANDIRALYQNTVSGTQTLDQAVASAEQAGTNLASQVNRVAQAGAKVLISTVPDQSFTPDGNKDPAKAAALHRISQRFNAKLRIGLLDDGHKIGLLLFDENVQAIVNNPVSFASTDPACNDATLDNVLTCTTDTLRVLPDGVTTALVGTWLWADRFHIAPIGHQQLCTLAITRAANNPF